MGFSRGRKPPVPGAAQAQAPTGRQEVARRNPVALSGLGSIESLSGGSRPRLNPDVPSGLPKDKVDKVALEERGFSKCRSNNPTTKV